MSIRIGHIEFDHVRYDGHGDVLYLSVGDVREASESVQTPEGHVVRLDDSGEQVHRSGARRRDDRDRPLRRLGQAERQEACGALVDPHVQPQPAEPVGLVQRERERCVTRAGAEHGFSHTPSDHLVDHDRGQRRRRVHW